jgi:hypothetical protein
MQNFSSKFRIGWGAILKSLSIIWVANLWQIHLQVSALSVQDTLTDPLIFPSMLYGLKRDKSSIDVHAILSTGTKIQFYCSISYNLLHNN